MKQMPDVDEFQEGLTAAVEVASRYLASLRDGAVLSQRSSAAVDVPDGIGLAPALSHFVEKYEGALSRSPGPRYWGFVTGGVTPAAMVGDWLTAAYDQNASHRLGSIAAQIELATVQACARLWGIPTTLHGQFVSGSTASNLAGLAAAREWAGRRSGVDINRHGVAGASLRVLAGAPHASIRKALSVLGIGRDAVEAIPCLPGRTAIDVSALARQLAASSVPTIVVASAGEVNTGDFDDLVAVADLTSKHEAWLHIDGAFGLFAALSSTHHERTRGVERADSITVDLHKWMNVPYDSALIYCKHPELQRAVFDSSGSYLGSEPDPLHYTPENSRRLRALPVWFTIAAYGREGIAGWVDRNIAHAHKFADLLQKNPQVRLLSPVHLNIVCFGFVDEAPELRDRVIQDVADRGIACLTPTSLFGRPGIRAAFVNWRTMEQDLPLVAEAIARATAA